eukprot:7368419-Prymnesium_polylepis.1
MSSTGRASCPSSPVSSPVFSPSSSASPKGQHEWAAINISPRGRSHRVTAHRSQGGSGPGVSRGNRAPPDTRADGR